MAGLGTWICLAGGALLCIVLGCHLFRKRKKLPTVPPNVVVVHHFFGRGLMVPSKSPFPMKLETFLRMTKTPYMNDHSGRMSKKGKTPWIEFNDTEVADSQFCLDFLKKKNGIDLNTALSTQQKSVARAFLKLIEENFYWTLCIELFCNKDNIPVLKSSAPLKGAGFWLYYWFVRRAIRSATWGHGIGRHSVEEVWGIGQADIEALSNYLGDKKYFMGDDPSEIDCSLFGMLTFLLVSMQGTRYETFTKENHPNLVSYFHRMKSTYWPDWDNLTTASDKFTDDHGKIYFPENIPK
ncbi:failed axon connections homolog [Saccostrea echinata]|uniref:failed axon connections homolog n=1 Tax=Saccostrea echinata TaxID=191078 RepID=UPI002A834973|nr:failed axon connections homolog [Saccostrea echinata]